MENFLKKSEKILKKGIDKQKRVIYTLTATKCCVMGI